MSERARELGLSIADLGAAVAAALITREQSERLLRLSAERATTAGQADNENLRLISSFNDIFVTIGIVLFIGALVYLLVGWGWWAGIAVAAASWILAEVFTRVRRLALPSIVLLLIFSVSIFMTVIGIVAPSSGFFEAGKQGAAVIFPGLAATGAAYAHWLRFHVPITVAAGAAGVVVTLIGVLGGLFENHAAAFLPALYFVAGLLVFLAAMRFDMADRARLTRNADIAFWLHLLAAPLIVHPVVWHMASAGNLSGGDAVSILGVFLLLATIALIIDRRALMVSSLSYLVYAASRLISLTQWESSAFAFAVLIVGAMVLFLSFAWRPLRAAVLRLLPLTITARVPLAA